MSNIPPTTASAPPPAPVSTSTEMMPPPAAAPSSMQEGANANSGNQNTGIPAATPTPVSELTTLRTHIQSLTELNNRLQAIRHVPARLLRPPCSDPLMSESTLLIHGFKELATIAETVRSEKVQEALIAARKSELADPSNLHSNLRRENLKRRRPPSPESPQPYRETEAKDTTLLPPMEPGTIPVTLSALPAYIREHNKNSRSKLHIVAPKKGRSLECPITLRFMAPNVVTVFLTLDYSTSGEEALVVINATAIGSREQKPAHSQSDYMAFQQLSQQLAKVIRSDPLASLQAYVGLLSSYERLFTDTCSNCQRVISAEGHVPPVVRKRLPPSTDHRAPLWDVRHVVCKYEPPPPRASASEHGAELEGDGGGSVEGGGGSNL